MLENYCKEQPIAYNILKNTIDNKMLAHAYLFYSNNAKSAYDLAFCFAKSLLCPKSKIKCDDYNNCSICHRIDNNNFPELKIINPDGMWIKKDQLLELQSEFRMRPLEGNKKIYIINGADKLNVQAANSILKFLEEPEPNIIALLITDCIHNVLPTITSRCQLIALKCDDGLKDDITYQNISNRALLKIGQLYFKKGDDLNDFLEDAKNVTKLDAIVLFIKKYELLKMDILLETKKLWSDYFTEKEDYAMALDVMALFYKDVINFMYHRELEIFDYYYENIKTVAALNRVENIIKKLQKILLIKEKIKYNMNLNLLMDKLIIEMGRGEQV